MINYMIDAAAKKLFDSFLRKIPVYTEQVRQNVQTPCFFVEGGVLSEKRIVGNRYRLQMPLRISYYPPKNGHQSDLHQMGENLTNTLEYLTGADGDKFRGTGMRAEIANDMLLFSVKYETFAYKSLAENPLPMETLTLHQRTE
ncbi:MAG: hypothetical protein RR977_00985 [Oscillospiraceae bacterium]